jgi:pimeloyl-ACP methyl ester carboxylesterase
MFVQPTTMKTLTGKFLELTFLFALALVYAIFAAANAHLSPLKHADFGLSSLPIEGRASFYTCSEPGQAFKEGLPVIIQIGNAFSEKPDSITRWIGRLGEPVLLIWSDLLSDLSGDTRIDDPAVWERKRREFTSLLSRYREILRFDGRRVYLTGSGFAGAYAWMLAYDQPEQYAGVVVMSAPCNLPQIQERVVAARAVVTVVVLRENHEWLLKHRAEVERTGRLIEAQNPHSKFSIRSGGGHGAMTEWWAEGLKYILQFRREESSTGSRLKTGRGYPPPEDE